MNADKALELARLAYPNDENLRVAYMLGLNAGAEWKEQQMMDEWLKDRDGCFWDGVEEGKKAMEEQMNPSGSSEIPNDLEEAAEEWAENEAYGKSDAEFEMAYKGFIAGAKRQKEQMLKDAMEGKIGATGFHNSIFIKEPEWVESLDRLHKGDKVKIIIVKED